MKHKMLVQWMYGENGFKDLVHLDTGNILVSTNLDVSFAKFDLDIESMKMRYERKQDEKEIEIVEPVKKMKLVRNIIRCKICGTILESKFTHDFQQCECGNFIDGGLSYQRCGGNLDDIENLSEWKEIDE